MYTNFAPWGHIESNASINGSTCGECKLPPRMEGARKGTLQSLMEDKSVKSYYSYVFDFRREWNVHVFNFSH